MDEIIKALLGYEKDALLYLSMGLTGGFLGTLIRISRRDRTARYSLIRAIFDILTWALAGAAMALVVDLHPAISLLVGLFGPALYDLLENYIPRYLAAILFNRSFMPVALPEIKPASKTETEAKNEGAK